MLHLTPAFTVPDAEASSIAVLAATMVWEALTPVSVFWGLALPLFVNWVCYDRLVMNPIMVGLMLMLPYKFIPGAQFRWL
jgi:hypothetical protein